MTWAKLHYLSRASTFAEAPGQVRDWSRAHPRHVPILVLIETKQDAIAALPTRPASFGPAELVAVDEAIRAAFGAQGLVTPDHVRGESATLPEAIRARGWPTLDSSRGRVLCALDDEGKTRDAYLEGHPTLRGRAMFVSVAPEHPAAARFKVNEPEENFDRIRQLVRDGFLVRTRADADTVQARRDDPSRRHRALASGARLVSPNYPEPDLRFSTYRVQLPGGAVARANPVVGPDVSGDVEATPAPPELTRRRPELDVRKVGPDARVSTGRSR